MASSSSNAFDSRPRKNSFKTNLGLRSRKNSVLSISSVTERDALLNKVKDPKLQKEAALRHKLRSYEMYTAIKKGYMMSSAQFCAWVRYYLHNSSVLDSRNRRLNPQGRIFVRDLRAWVEAVVELIEEKNYDDKIQDFLWRTSHVRAGSSQSHLPLGSNQRSRDDVSKAMASLRLLGSLLYGSTEFRRLIFELIVVIIDIFADSVSSSSSPSSSTSKPQTAPPNKFEFPTSPAGYESGSPSSVADDVASVFRRSRKQEARVKLRRHDSRDEVENFLRQKFPKQRRDSLINRLKRAFADIQKDPEFAESVEFLLNLIRAYLQKLQPVQTDKGKEIIVDGVEVRDEFDGAVQELKGILSSLAGGKSLEDVTQRLVAVVDTIRNDFDLTDFYKDASDYLYALLRDKEFAMSDPADSEGHQLYDRATDLFNAKKDPYRADFEELLVEIRVLCQAIENDRHIRKVTEAGKKVWSDIVLVQNEGFGISFRRAVIRNMFDTMLPKFLAEVRFFPISRVEYRDKSLDLILENVVLESDNFLPRKMSMSTTQKAEFSTEWSYRSAYASTTTLSLNSFSFSVKDASFLLRRRKGRIRISDQGFLNVKCVASTSMALESSLYSDDYDYDYEDNSVDAFFRVGKVKVVIHKFDVRIKPTKHRLLAKLLNPIIRPWIKRLLSRILEEKLRSMFETCDREIYGMADRVRSSTIASGGKGSMENWVRAMLSKPRDKVGGGTTAKKVDDDGGRDGGGGGKGGNVDITVGRQKIFPGERGPGPVLFNMADARGGVKGDGNGGSWRTDVFDLRRNYMASTFAES